MILGAGEGQLPLIDRAKEAGWFTIVVSPPGNYPGFQHADACRFIDISDREDILKLAIDEKVSAIATDQTDISVPSVLYVAEQMNLPHIVCNCIDNFRMKSSMREVCLKNGIPSIPFCVTGCVEEAISFYRSLPGGLAIVKPIDSQGSRGVKKVTSLIEVKEAINDALRFSFSRLVIIEQFIVGREIEVDTVIRDGSIINTLIGDVYNFGAENEFSAYIREYPTVLSLDVQEKVSDFNRRIIKAFGLITGWTHGEFIYSEEQGQVYLLEIGARGGGSFIGSDIVREMIGVSTDEMAFCTAVGDDSFFDRIYLHDTFCAYRCFYLPEGEIISIRIDNNILDKPFIVIHNLYRLHVGMHTHKNIDKTSRSTIVIKEDSRERLRERIAEVENSISIQVQASDGRIHGIIWR